MMGFLNGWWAVVPRGRTGHVCSHVFGICMYIWFIYLVISGFSHGLTITPLVANDHKRRSLLRWNPSSPRGLFGIGLATIKMAGLWQSWQDISMWNAKEMIALLSFASCSHVGSLNQKKEKLFQLKGFRIPQTTVSRRVWKRQRISTEKFFLAKVLGKKSTCCVCP